MTLQRIDHVSVVVEDMDAAIAFFTAVGMNLEGQATVEGPTVDRLCGLEGIRADIAMMRTPDGHNRIELTKYHRPALVDATPAAAPPNTLGLRQIMFAVDDLDATADRLRAHGATPIGEPVTYGDQYKLAYLRGPAGIIVALAQQLR